IARHLDAGAPLSPSTRLTFDIARGISAVSFVQAQRARALIARDFQRAFEQVDVIVSPTTARTAPAYPPDAFAAGELDEEALNRMVWFTFPLNLTGLPAAQVPCGYDAAGLPIGMQIIAPLGSDLLALSVARAVEAVTERRRPPHWHDLLG